MKKPDLITDSSVRKNLPFLALGTAVAVLGGLCLYFGSMNSRIQNAEYSLPEEFTVTAHTGAMGTKDNTLESIIKGAQWADIVEFDINFLPDGSIVLSHDTPEEDDNYVSLESAFRTLANLPGIQANVDLKTSGSITSVETLAKEYGIADRIFFTGVSENEVALVKEQCPSIAYYLNCDIVRSMLGNKEYVDSIVKKVADCGAVGLNMSFKQCDPILTEALHKEGLLLSLYTANKKSEIYKALSMSPDNLTTKNPDIAKEMITK